MSTLFALGMVNLDMIGTLRLVGIIGGIVLLLIWFLSVKNTVALFYDKKKIRATLFFGLPGLILLVIGIFLMFSGKSMSSYLYVANYSSKDGRIEVEGKTFEIEASSWQMIEVRASDTSYSVKGFLGDSTVFDTTMGDGSWIASLSDDKLVVAEEVIYSDNSFANTDDLVYEMLMSPGIVRFSKKLESDLYDFDEEAPNTMSVSSSSSVVRTFDLQLLSQEDFLKMMIEAMGEEEGGSGLDSLLESIDEEGDSGAVREEILEEGE